VLIKTKRPADVFDGSTATVPNGSQHTCSTLLLLKCKTEASPVMVHSIFSATCAIQLPNSNKPIKKLAYLHTTISIFKIFVLWSNMILKEAEVGFFSCNKEKLLGKEFSRNRTL
jgi:hypothetical protein